MSISSYVVPAVIATQLAFAAVVGAEGEKIVEVAVEGNKRIEAAAILNVVRLKAGDTVYSDKTDADLRAIYKLGHFKEVIVSTKPSPKGNVLVYTVTEKAVIRDIRFDGNKELSTSKLKEVLEIKQNAIFSPKELAKSITKLKKLYQENGYYLAEITETVEKRDKNDMTVTFRINEGKKVLIRKITLEGNKAFSNSTLKGNRLLLKMGIIETKEKWFMSWLTDAGTYKEEALKNDSLLIADYYLNHGYMNVKVGEPVVKLTEDKEALEVTIGITEGDQYRVGNIDFKGELLETAETLHSKIKLEKGEIFNRSVVRSDIATLTDLYGDKGYAFATANPATKVDESKKIVDLSYDMEKGDLIYIERVGIAGNSKTRDKVIRREMRVKEGELFSATGMKQSKKNLMNTGYFEDVSIATPKGSSSNKMNVTTEVKEKPTGTFSIGGGYSTLDGIIGQGSIAQNNFLGLGLKANLSGSIGGKSQTYSVGLTDPYFLDSKWSFGGDIYRSERDYLDYTRRLTGADIRGGYPINDNISTFLMYKFEVKDLYNPTAGYRALHDDPTTAELYPLGTSTTSAFTASLTHNNTDYRLDPSTGFINSISAEYAGVGGTNRYARYITTNTWFKPLYKKLIFSTKLELGYIHEVGQKVPIDEKFYLGGINSLRGYKARTVSPTTIKRNVITDTTTTPYTYGDQLVYMGGNKEAFGQTELTFPLLAEFGIKGVTFFDYGNSYGENDKMFSSILMSYGAGIRWQSPIGPLRLEYGIPVNPRSGIDNKSGRFEFSIGSMF